MTLDIKSAVLVVVEAMEEEARSWEDSPSIARLFLSYARQIRTVLSIAPDLPQEDSDPSPQEVAKQFGHSIFDPREVLKRKAERDVQESQSRYNREEVGSEMTLLVGGTLDGDYVPIDPRMPIGAKTRIGTKQIYQLKEDRKLHFIGEG